MYDLITELDDELRQKPSDLKSLIAAWEERRTELRGIAALEEMQQRMRRRWAIETGMIEGLYSLDRGTTQLLIDRGLHADLISHGDGENQPAEIIDYLHDQAHVYDWLFDFVASQRPLTTSYIRELHALLTRSQETTKAIDGLGRFVDVPLVKGEWKELPNNPTREDGSTHEYCPPELVAAEMDRLLSWYTQYEAAGVAPEVSAAWLHHRFTQIHPFQDGNGRVARAITALVLIRARLFPMSIAPEEKAAYIDALEQADEGNLEPFVSVVVGIEKRELRRALSIAEDLSDEQRIFETALAKVRERSTSHEQVLSLGQELHHVAQDELKQARNQFRNWTAQEHLRDKFRASVFVPKEDRREWYFSSIVSCAGRLGYFADTKTFHKWVQLRITNLESGRHTDLVVSIHSVGRSFKGILACTAFIEEIVEAEGERPREVLGPALAVEDAFTFGYLDQADSLAPRFRKWLEAARLSLFRTWNDTL